MTISRKRLWTRIAISLVLAGVLAGGWFRLRGRDKTTDVPTAQARRGEFAVLATSRGSLAAARTFQMTAPLDVQDLQIVWLAPAGSDVKKGQVVIRFDASKLQQDLKEKKVALQQAQASLDQAMAQGRIDADQDKLDLASARFDREKARLEVSKKAIVSDMEGQKSAIDFGIAEEKVKVQEATTELHGKSNDAKVASQTRLRNEAKAELDRISHRLTQMELKSPLDGVVNYMTNQSQGWMNAQPFKVGDHVSAGMTIAEIPDLTTLEMESKVDEVERGLIEVGNEVRVHVDAFPEKVFAGKLTTVSLLTEQSFIEWPPTRTFRAYAHLDERDARLRPGMNAGADIVETKIPDAISIPAKALFTLHGKPIVYVKTAKGYVATEIRVRARNADELAVEGLGQGTVIALANPEQNPA